MGLDTRASVTGFVGEEGSGGNYSAGKCVCVGRGFWLSIFLPGILPKKIPTVPSGCVCVCVNLGGG